MIDITWPTGLPQLPLTDGFSLTIGRSEVIQTDMDTGPGKRRRRSLSSPRPMKITMVLTIEQVLLFEEWYDNTIMGGVKPFSWINPVTQKEEYFQITDPTTRPTITPENGAGQHFLLSLDLSIIP